MGIDVDADVRVYVADYANQRIVFLRMDAVDEDLVWLFSRSDSSWYPLDVAWDNNGTISDNTDDYLWIVHDRVENLIERRHVDLNAQTVGPAEIAYGGWGSGEGKFLDPSGICIGPAGGGRHSGRIYVVDRGNERLVRLERPLGSTTEITWAGEYSTSDWDPTSCSTDYDGDVHVTDRKNHRLWKFSWDLEYLKYYGRYGVGQHQYGTFAEAHDIAVVWGPYFDGVTTYWTGYGRVVTAERWDSLSGGHDHRLGVEIPWDYAYAGTGGPEVYGGTLIFLTTAAGTQTIDVLDASGQFVDRVRQNYSALSGTQVVTWDGRMQIGRRRVYAPQGQYRFEMTVESHYGGDPPEPFRVATAQTPLFLTNCGDCVVPKSVVESGGPEEWGIAQDLSFASSPVQGSEGLMLNVAASAVASGAAETRARGVDYAAILRSGIRAVRIAVPDGPDDAAGKVRLEIYDLAGRLIRREAFDPLPAGWHRYVWDGRDDRGRAVPAGAYIVIMHAPGFRGSTKLVLIR